jgi:hypothetical protein
MGQIPRTEADISYMHQVNSGSMPTVVIVPDNTTQLVFLKEGKAVFPRRIIPASEEMYEVGVLVSLLMFIFRPRIMLMILIVPHIQICL